MITLGLACKKDLNISILFSIQTDLIEITNLMQFFEDTLT